MTCQSGNEGINPGSEVFELDLNKQSSSTIGGINIDVGRGVSNYIKVPEFKYEAGKNYELRVRDNYTIAPIEYIGDADLSDLSIDLTNEQQ
jgi:hypothetical protein